VAGFIPAGGVLRQRQNAGDIDAWGVEAELAGDFGPARTWRLSAAWTTAEVDGGTSAPQLTGLRPAQTPELAVTAETVWRPLDRLTVRSTLRYESERFDDDLNLRRLSAAFSSDLRIDWRATSTANVYAAVENLSDAEVETGQTANGIESFDMPRTVRVGLIWRP
jgi:outer membrane receptor protein involved in Fe transport